MAGWVAVLTGHTADAQRWAAFLDTASFDLVPVIGSASFESSWAMLRAAMSRWSRADGDRRELRGCGGAAVEPWLASALILCAEAQLLVGDVDRAVRPLRGNVHCGSNTGQCRHDHPGQG